MLYPAPSISIVGQVTQTSVHRPVMRMFFLPVASMALRKPASSHEFIEVRSMTGWPGKTSSKLRPDVAAEGFGLHRGEDGGNVEFLRDLREQRHVVDQRRPIDVGDAEGHLRLVVDEDDGAVFRRVEFVVLAHGLKTVPALIVWGKKTSSFRPQARRPGHSTNSEWTAPAMPRSSSTSSSPTGSSAALSRVPAFFRK